MAILDVELYIGGDYYDPWKIRTSLLKKKTQTEQMTEFRLKGLTCLLT